MHARDLQDCEFMRTGSGMHVSGAGTAVRAALCKFGDLRGTAVATEQSAIMSMQVCPLRNWLSLIHI